MAEAYMEFADTAEGRKERYAFWTGEDGLQLVRQWRREGASFERLSALMGVACSTLSKWRSREPRLEAAIKQTDDLVDAMVENALLKRALGYTAQEVEEELVEGEMRVVRRRERHFAPDTKACLSWLYSRRSDRWRVQQAPLDTTADEVLQAKQVLVTIARAAGEALRGEVPLDGAEVEVPSLPDGGEA